MTASPDILRASIETIAQDVSRLAAEGHHVTIRDLAWRDGAHCYLIRVNSRQPAVTRPGGVGQREIEAGS